MLFVPQLFTGYWGTDNSGLSPRVWAKVQEAILSPDGASRLVFVGDDFLTFKGAGTYLTPMSELGYTGYIDTGDTIVSLADEVGGVVALTTDTSDNDEVWLASGDATSVLGKISDTAGSDFLTVFECRVKVGSIGDDVSSIFCGLSEEGCAAADSKVDNTGVLADKDHIGFDSVHVNGGTTGTNALLNFVYKKAGQTQQTLITTVHTLVADDFVKLGFVYDPSEVASKRIKVFVNNTEQTTYGTATQIATATFPDGEEMGALFGVKNGTTTASELAIDWWAYAQLIKPAAN